VQSCVLHPRLTRARLLAAGARHGGVLLVAGTGLGALAAPASADPLADGDLAFARLLTATELLSIDFYTRVLAADRFGPVCRKYAARALADENMHYASVSAILSGAGLVPATAQDFDFNYPAAAFSSRGSIATLGRDLETAFLGAYLGAVAAVQSRPLLQPLARIGASEAQHLGIWGHELGGRPSSLAFPAPLTIDQASAVLDEYTS
jgi:hypothetical protein